MSLENMQIYSSVAELPLQEWQAFVPGNQPFLRMDYLEALETGCGKEMEFRYVVFRENGKMLGFAYFQMFNFNPEKLNGYTDGQKGTLWKQFRHSLGKAVEQLAIRPHHRLLLNGNAFLSGENGLCHDESVPKERALQWLYEAAESISQKERYIFATLFKDQLVSDKKGRQFFQENNFHCFEAEPDMGLEIQDEWESFADYLEALKPKYRQRARSAYKKSQELQVISLSLEEVEAQEEALFSLFEEVLKKDKFNLKEIKIGYFSCLKRLLEDDFEVKGYYLNGRLIAFSSSIHQKGQLHAHYIGYQADQNRDLKLYQRILYDLVEMAISEDCDELRLGRTAMEIKSCLGALPKSYTLYLRLNNRIYNRLVRPLLTHIPNPEWQPRQPFKG